MFSPFFSADYRTARQRFRAAALDGGWSCDEHLMEGRGPEGETLAVDVAMSPGSGSGGQERGVLVTCGLHGVEGFFGSAVQLALLSRPTSLPVAYSGVRFVFVHGLNPFGFAWRRRVNEANVDLNRNFLPPGEAYGGCPEGYRRLDRLLNPKRPPARFDGFYLQAGAALLRHGMPALKQAIAAGQYEFPQGLFFGGNSPSATLRLVREALPVWIGGCRRVTHLDLHTGLGRWGTYKLLLEQTLAPERRNWLSRSFGAGTWEESSSHGVSYVSRGTFGQWCAAQLPDIDYLYACAEFGTYGPLAMLAGLRRENQATHWAGDDSAAVERARDRLVELFCPASARWRNRVVSAGVELVKRAAGGET